MRFDYDVIVIGGGAGGATFAHSCARAGKSVLILERGGAPPEAGRSHDEHSALIRKLPYDDREIDVNGVSRRLYMGGILGGGTSLYGGALIRPSEEDFRPGRYYGARIPRAIWDWPISYEELEPYYDETERLYGVAGREEDDFGPLGRPTGGFPGQPLPLHPLNQRLIAANRRKGLRPFQLPLAIDSSRCLRCGVCAGYVCPTGARASSVQLIEASKRLGQALTVRTGVEVERFVREPGGGPPLLSVVDRETGRTSTLRARNYALAAGAFGSPLLLLRSGFEHPQIGRNYMMHHCAIVAGVFPRETEADTTFIKQVGFADFYLGTKRYRHKMGLVQSIAVPGPLMAAKVAPFVPAPVRDFLRKRSMVLAGLIEDLPNPRNRVSLGADGRGRITHRYARYDIARRERMAPLIARILKRAGAVYTINGRYSSHEHVAHQCGTLRFGNDPASSVLDADCRLRSAPDVFVVDGSFMPTSLGVGPGLTIMANALRVADRALAAM